MAVMTDVAETGLLQKLADAVAGVEPLGIELVGDHAHFVVHDNFARDQAFPVLADRALAADKVVFIDPLPRPPVEVVVHMAAVGNVQYDLPTGAQDLTDRGQHFLVSLLVGEVAKRVAHDGNAVHAVLRKPRVARIPLLEQHLQSLALGPLLGQAHEIARAVQSHHVLETAAGQLEAVPSLSAAKVEDVAIRLNGRPRSDEVYLAAGVLQVFDDIAVGLHVQGIEKLPPPFFGQVRLQIRNRAEARTGGRTPGSLRLRRHYHGGRPSSLSVRLALAGEELASPTRRRLQPAKTRPTRSQQNANVLVPHNPLSNFYLWTIDPRCKLFLSSAFGGTVKPCAGSWQ